MAPAPCLFAATKPGVSGDPIRDCDVPARFCYQRSAKSCIIPPMPNANSLPIVSSQQVAKSVVANQQAIAEEIRNQANKATDDPLRRARLVNSFEEIAGELQKGSAPHLVLDTPRNAMASVLQSFIAQKAAESNQVDTTDDVPVVKFSDDDLLEWIKTGFIGLVDGQDKFTWKTAPDDPDPLFNTSRHLRIAVFGDWGTGAYAAPVIANSIQQDD